MNNKSSNIAIAAALTILAITMSGCSSQNSLVKQGIASVETKPSKKVEILWTDVFRESEEIRVCGVVRRRHHTIYPLKTHVDSAILTPDGKVLREARTPDIYVPRFVPRKGINWKRFEIRFPDMPGNFNVRAAAHSE